MGTCLLTGGLVGCSSSNDDDPDSSNEDQSLEPSSCDSQDIPDHCLDEMCIANNCGDDTSAYDQYGCVRSSCLNDSDCGAKTRCRFVSHVHTPVALDIETGECIGQPPDEELTQRLCMPARGADRNVDSPDQCRPKVTPDCLDAICVEAKCGKPNSVYDEVGCFRKRCSTDSDCESKNTCRHVHTTVEHPVVDNDTGFCTGKWITEIVNEKLCMPNAA